MPSSVGSGGVASISVMWDMKTAVRVTQIRWTSYEEKTSASPTWVLEASNNGTTWVNALVSTPTPSLSGKWNTFNATSVTTTQYRYWRLSTEDHGSGTSIVRVGDFRLYNDTHQYQVNEIVVNLLGYAINAGAMGSSPTLTIARTVNPTGIASVFVTGTQALSSLKTLVLSGISTAAAFGLHTLSASNTISVSSINAGAMGGAPTVYGTLKVSSIDAGAMGNMPALSQTSPTISTRRRGRVVMIT